MRKFISLLILLQAFSCVSARASDELTIIQDEVVGQTNGNFINDVYQYSGRNVLSPETVVTLVSTSRDWKGVLTFVGDACSSTSPTWENIVAMNNRTVHSSTVEDEGFARVPKVFVVTRGGSTELCSWSSKLLNAQNYSNVLELNLVGVVLVDFEDATNPPDNLTSAISLYPDNDIPQKLSSGTTFVPTLFVTYRVGQGLLNAIAYSAATNRTPPTFARLSVVGPNPYEDNSNSLFSWMRTDAGRVTVDVIVVFIILITGGTLLYRYRKAQQRRAELQRARQARTVMPKAALEDFPIEEFELTKIINSTCPICLEEFCEKDSSLEAGMGMGSEVRKLPCRHGFCIGCIDPWLTTKSPSCPICKETVWTAPTEPSNPANPNPDAASQLPPAHVTIEIPTPSPGTTRQPPDEEENGEPSTSTQRVNTCDRTSPV